MARMLALLIANGAIFCLAAGAVHGQSTTRYADLVYSSGGLRIQAYLYKPDGDGPFPAVIYNHGSRVGRERESVPFEHIGALLTRAGYVVLVPERRGYGRSDGPSWPGAVGRDRGRFVPRLREETEDVLAAADYLRAQPFLDAKRLGIMGWSFGGVVTMFAVSRSPLFAAAINQAGGALTWDDVPDIRVALIEAAERSTSPPCCRWRRTIARPPPSPPSARYSSAAAWRTRRWSTRRFSPRSPASRSATGSSRPKG